MRSAAAHVHAVPKETAATKDELPERSDVQQSSTAIRVDGGWYFDFPSWATIKAGCCGFGRRSGGRPNREISRTTSSFSSGLKPKKPLTQYFLTKKYNKPISSTNSIQKRPQHRLQFG